MLWYDVLLWRTRGCCGLRNNTRLDCWKNFSQKTIFIRGGHVQCVKNTSGSLWHGSETVMSAAMTCWSVYWRVFIYLFIYIIDLINCVFLIHLLAFHFSLFKNIFPKSKINLYYVLFCLVNNSKQTDLTSQKTKESITCSHEELNLFGLLLIWSTKTNWLNVKQAHEHMKQISTFCKGQLLLLLAWVSF